ncbi:MAG: lysylphosphatidylglycerol synthase transmembrane domain-containing protein, partial [Myxococcota bacterium]|nr:lysylphosphatidylglycerol synthase transmembrane domain-containing protein [Myxococcota bacterium]
MEKREPEGDGHGPRHPLERLTGRNWAIGLARLAVAVAIAGAAVAYAGRETWDVLLRIEHLPWLAAGTALTLAQRVLRIRKWAWIVEGFPLPHRPWAWLLRIQFVGLFANLVVPVSEALKVWAISDRRRDVTPAVETLVMDTAQEALAVGAVALAAALVAMGPGGWWTCLPGGCVLLLAALVAAAVRMRPRRVPGYAVRLWPRMLAVSFLEAACLLGAYAAALAAVGVDMPAAFLVAVFPLLYMSHVVSLTPAGLGVREALFALVFGGLSRTPTEIAVATALMISAMQIVVAVGAGGIALAWPGRAVERPPRDDGEGTSRLCREVPLRRGAV